MGLLDSVKNRLSANLKLTQISYMSHPAQIVAFCQGLAPDERTAIMNGIDSAFKWQPVAQIAQAMFPSYYSGGVSAEALDLVKGGQVSGGIELMRQQNQYYAPPSYGFTPAQQASLSFAWVVLNALNQQAGAAPPARPGAPANHFCSQCGKPIDSGARFCTHCGSRL